MLSSGALHAQLYWDSNGATAGFGATNGTWGTSAFWSTDSTGASATANTTTTISDTVYFGTDALGYTGGRTVTLSGTQNVGNIIFGSASGAVTISGGTALNLGGATPTITVNNSTSTISSVITGSNGLTKDGDGLLILTGVNTYSGTTLVTGGTIRFGSNYNVTWNEGRLSANSNLHLNGGIVQAYYYKTMALGTAAGEIQITGGRSGFTNLQGDATSNFITFTNASTTVIWGAFGEGAATGYFNPSTLVLNDIGASSVMRLQNGFDLNGAARTIEVSATGKGAGRGTYGILTGDLSGSGASLVKTGAGTLMLDGANTYNGGTTINAGGVWFRDTAAMSASGTVTVNDGGILSVGVGSGLWTTGTSGVGTIGGLLAGDGGQTASQIVYNGNVGIGLNISGSQTYAGDIANVGSSLSLHVGNKDAGSASDPFTFAGTLNLSGNNTYTGGTFINAGTLVAGSATALGNGGDITFGAAGGTLQYTASSAANDYGSRIKNSSGAIILNTNGENVTLSNLGSGNTGGLTKSGNGILTFTGTNSYSGATTLSAGTIAVYNGTLNTSGGLVDLNASDTTISILGGSGVSSTWNLGNQNLQTKQNGIVSNVQMVIDGDGVAGSAIVTNVNNLFWGRTANNSTLTVTDGGQMSVNGEVRIGNPYYNTTGGANITIGGGTATSTFSGDGGDDFYIGYGERRGASNNIVTVTTNGVLTNVRDMYVGHVNNAQNNGAPPASGNTLTVTSTGTASMRSVSVGYAQNGYDANANVVQVTNGGTLSTTGTSYVGRANTTGSQSNGNTLTVTGTGSSWNAGNQTVYVGFANASGESNNNILTVGTGASVTNVNALTVGGGAGTTTGNQLVINGTLTATTITVSDGNILGGSGTINGAVTVDGLLKPGNSPGVLSFGNSLALGSTAATTMELAGSTRGTGYDGVDVTGALTYNGSLTFDLGTTFGAGSYTFDIFGFGSQSGDFASVDMIGLYSASFTDMGSGIWELTSGTDTWSFSQSTGDLSLTVIPEPGFAFLGLIGALGLVIRRRRH